MNSSNATFRPWIGNSYQQGFAGVRTLILGESHYQWDGVPDIESTPEITSELIAEQITGDYTKAFWTKIATAFLGHSPTLEDKGTFWHSVAFYNYVQSSAGDGPRVRPTEGSWSDSEAAFAQILDELRPEFVVVLGYTLWERLPKLDGAYGPSVTEAPQTETWRFPRSYGTSLAYGIIHPSAGFSSLEWHKHIKAARALL